MQPSLFTIGHSTHPLDAFLDLLSLHEIAVLADVRSRPYSQFCPQFTRDALRVGVESRRIAYRFLGRSLGGMPDDPTLYDADGHPVYARMAEQPEFKRGIKELVQLAENQRTAIVCSEEDPSRCHRRHLIAPALLASGFGVIHIRGDGHTDSEQDLRAHERETEDDQLSLFGEQGL